MREIIVRGILETQWTQVLATCAFLLVLGVLMVFAFGYGNHVENEGTTAIEQRKSGRQY